MVCTIYGIRCRKSGRIYIGRTASPLNERFKKHVYRLNHNIHYSKEMQEDYNKYGRNNFDIYQIFQTSDYEYAKRLEKLVILALQTNTSEHGYNSQDPFFRNKHSEYLNNVNDNAEQEVRMRVFEIFDMRHISAISRRTGYKATTLRSWKNDPTRIRAVDLLRLERKTGTK